MLPSCYVSFPAKSVYKYISAYDIVIFFYFPRLMSKEILVNSVESALSHADVILNAGRCSACIGVGMPASFGFSNKQHGQFSAVQQKCAPFSQTQFDTLVTGVNGTQNVAYFLGML